jgi:hypothetical protein
MGMEQWRNDTGKGKPKSSEKNLSHCRCPPQIPHGLTRAQTQASTVGGQRPTAEAMAWSQHKLNLTKTLLKKRQCHMTDVDKEN